MFRTVGFMAVTALFAVGCDSPAKVIESHRASATAKLAYAQRVGAEVAARPLVKTESPLVDPKGAIQVCPYNPYSSVDAKALAAASAVCNARVVWLKELVDEKERSNFEVYGDQGQNRPFGPMNWYLETSELLKPGANLSHLFLQNVKRSFEELERTQYLVVVRQHAGEASLYDGYLYDLNRQSSLGGFQFKAEERVTEYVHTNGPRAGAVGASSNAFWSNARAGVNNALQSAIPSVVVPSILD